MRYLNHLEKHGLQAQLAQDGSLSLLGLESLDHVTRVQLTKWIDRHRQQILDELKSELEPVVLELDLRHFCTAKGQQRKPSRPKRKHITPDMLRSFKVARPWLLHNLLELQNKGWTRKQLFRAGRYIYPCGDWGPAWSPNWLRPGVEVSIDQDGAIRWSWTEAGGRQVTQSSSPF